MALNARSRGLYHTIMQSGRYVKSDLGDTRMMNTISRIGLYCLHWWAIPRQAERQVRAIVLDAQGNASGICEGHVRAQV